MRTTWNKKWESMRRSPVYYYGSFRIFFGLMLLLPRLRSALFAHASDQLSKLQLKLASSAISLRAICFRFMYRHDALKNIRKSLISILVLRFFGVNLGDFDGGFRG